MSAKQIKIEGNLTSDDVRREQFSAWITVIASAAVLLLVGHFQYSFGVFVKPLIDRFGWSRAAVSSIASTRSLLFALLSPVSGILSDRYGARRLILVGIFLFGLGFVLSSFATSLWQFYLFFGVLIGTSNGILLSPAIANVTKWFGGKAARANGVTMSGLSLAQILFPPVATYLIGQYGWEACVIILGVTTWLLGALSWGFIKHPSSRIRQQLEAPSAESLETTKPDDHSNDFNLSEALHTSSFWIIFLIMVATAICFQMVVVHIVVAAVDLGVAAGAAAIILTVIGVTNTLGRLTVSGLADKVGGRALLATSMALQAGTLLVLAQAGDLRAFYITAAVYGLLYGSIMPVIPSLAGSFFGTKSVGSTFGTLNFGYLGGGVIGPLLAGYIFDITGSYYLAFIISAALAAVAFLLCLRLKRPVKKVVVA